MCQKGTSYIQWPLSPQACHTETGKTLDFHSSEDINSITAQKTNTETDEL
jgi:hypothetical protein